MCARYLKISNNQEDLQIYSGLSQPKQYFLLRKQYDSRMKQLSQLMLGQHTKIMKLENLVEKEVRH